MTYNVFGGTLNLTQSINLAYADDSKMGLLSLLVYGVCYIVGRQMCSTVKL